MTAEDGLCLAAAVVEGATGEARVVARPLRGENLLPDQIRAVVFGDEADDVRATAREDVL